MHGAGNPAMCVQGNEDIIDEAGDVLPGRYAGDWPGQDVIEHEGGDAHFGKGSAQSLFHHAVNADVDKHRAALEVHCSDGEREKIDGLNCPESSQTYYLSV